MVTLLMSTNEHKYSNWLGPINDLCMRLLQSASHCVPAFSLPRNDHEFSSELLLFIMKPSEEHSRRFALVNLFTLTVCVA